MDVYLANCNHGTQIVPEYRFFLKSGESETPLTGWNSDGILACPAGELDHCTLRVYARILGTEEPAVWYDYLTNDPY